MFLQSTRMCLIACRYLVEGYMQNKRITAPQISKRFGMNVRMLNPAFSQLVRHGLLSSQVGGTEPGYIFTKDPKEITIYDILLTLEGEVKMQCCKEILSTEGCIKQEKETCLIYNTINKGLKDLKYELMKINLTQDYLNYTGNI